MKKNEELLQRCFDEDLNDDEMKGFFLQLSKDAGLRNEFRSLQSLQRGLRSTPAPAVPASLDERIRGLKPAPQLRLMPDKPAWRRYVSGKITVSFPVLAAALLLMVIGSYVAAVNLFVPAPETEYVYVVELQPIVIKSNYLQ